MSSFRTTRGESTGDTDLQKLEFPSCGLNANIREKFALKEKLTSYQQRVEQGIDQLLFNETPVESTQRCAIQWRRQTPASRPLIAASELFPQADPINAVAIECLRLH